MSEKQGTIVQVMGPVVDVAFDGGALPELKEALEVELDGRREVMEVAQHVGGDTVRCIMLSPSEGLGRGMAVTATGAPISVPVGEGVLGRMFNVLGDAIDEKGPVQTSEKWSIHRQPPAFENQRPVVDIFETGIKVIDLLAPYAKGGKIGLFGGIKNARFRRQVTPGDVLELECTILKQKGPVAVAEAKATVGGQLAVSAELTFALAKDL